MPQFNLQQLAIDVVIGQLQSLLIQYGPAVLLALVGVLVTYVIRRWAVARHVAQVTADVADLIADEVEAAEAAGLPSGSGPFKFARVALVVRQFLDERGVKGESRRVLEQHLPNLINGVVGLLAPPSAPQASPAEHPDAAAS
jgi:hypothetical protein